MMERFKCRNCGGEYSPVQQDGSLYFHACNLQLDLVEEYRIQTRNYRNENVQLGRDRRAAGITAEGAGVDPVAPCTLAEPTWIRKLKAEIAHRAEEE